MKGISHVKEHQRHVVDRAGHRVSGGTKPRKTKVRAVAQANSNRPREAAMRVVNPPERTKPEPTEKNNAETLGWTLRGGRRQRAPKERLGTWEALRPGSRRAGSNLDRE